MSNLPEVSNEVVDGTIDPPVAADMILHAKKSELVLPLMRRFSREIAVTLVAGAIAGVGHKLLPSAHHDKSPVVVVQHSDQQPTQVIIQQSTGAQTAKSQQELDAEAQINDAAIWGGSHIIDLMKMPSAHMQRDQGDSFTFDNGFDHADPAHTPDFEVSYDKSGHTLQVIADQKLFANDPNADNITYNTFEASYNVSPYSSLAHVQKFSLDAVSKAFGEPGALTVERVYAQGDDYYDKRDNVMIGKQAAFVISSAGIIFAKDFNDVGVRDGGLPDITRVTPPTDPSFASTINNRTFYITAAPQEMSDWMHMPPSYK